MALYKFGEIAFNSTEKKKPVESDKSVYIGLEHLDSKDLRVNRWGSDVAPIGDKLIMKKGDVLFGKRRAYQKKVAIAPFDGIFSAHGLVLRPKTDVVDKDFFPFFIASDYFLDAAIKISVGSLSPTINWGDLKELEFDLPSMEEQKRLAKILMAAEETRQAYKKLIKQTDDLIKIIYNEMIMNKSYDFMSISDVCKILNGYAFQSKLYTNSGIRVIRITNVQKGKIVDDNPEFYPISKQSEIQGYMLKENDLLVSLTGNVGRVGLVSKDLLPAGLNQRVACLRPNTNKILTDYLFYVLNQDKFEQDCIDSSNGIAQKNLSTIWLSNYQVPVPSENIQKEFVGRVQQAEQTKMATQQSLDALNETVRALVNRNFN